MVARSTIDIQIVVTGCNTIVCTAGVGPVGGVAHGHIHTVGIKDRSAAPARIAGQGGTEVFAEGQSLGDAAGAAVDEGVGGVARGAVGLDGEDIRRVGVEVLDGVGGAGDVGLHQSGVGRGEDIDAVGGAGVVGIGPGEGDAVGSDSADGEVGDLHAGGHLLEGHIVHVEGTAAFHHGEHQVGVGGGGGGQGNTILRMGGTGNLNRIHKRGGGDVGRIGHSINIHVLAVGGAAHLSPEGHAVGVHRVGGYVELGQNPRHHVGIGGTGRTIIVEAAAAGADITGVAVGIVGAAGSAGRDITLAAPRQSGGLGGVHNLVGLKTAGPRQADGAAGGAAADGGKVGDIAAAAVGHHAEGIAGVGVKASDWVGGSADVGGDNGLSVIDGVGGAGVAGIGPSQRQAAAGGLTGIDGQVGHLEAGGRSTNADVVNKDCTTAVVGCGEELQDNRLACIGSQRDFCLGEFTGIRVVITTRAGVGLQLGEGRAVIGRYLHGECTAARTV